jgi:hypothetical protein
MRDDAPETFPLQAEESNHGHFEKDDGEWEPPIPEEPPLEGPGSFRGGDFEKAERGPGSLYGDERGGQRPKKP